jgi:hypothetical protein
MRARKVASFGMRATERAAVLYLTMRQEGASDVDATQECRDNSLPRRSYTLSKTSQTRLDLAPCQRVGP